MSLNTVVTCPVTYVSAYAMLQWACASIGAILVTINPAYRVHELVGRCSMTVIIEPRNVIRRVLDRHIETSWS